MPSLKEIAMIVAVIAAYNLARRSGLPLTDKLP